MARIRDPGSVTIRYEKTGEKQVWNESKKKYETKPVYGNVRYTVQVKVVDGSLTGSFDLADRSGRMIEKNS